MKMTGGSAMAHRGAGGIDFLATPQRGLHTWSRTSERIRHEGLEVSLFDVDSELVARTAESDVAA